MVVIAVSQENIVKLVHRTKAIVVYLIRYSVGDQITKRNKII